MCHTCEINGARQLAETEIRISNLQSELQSARDGNSNQSKAIERIQSAHDTLAKELNEANLRLCQMDDLREQADHMSNLVQDCGKNGLSLAVLQEEIASLRNVNEQMTGNHRADVQNKIMEIEGLRHRLNSAQEVSMQVTTLQEELEKYKIEDANSKHAKSMLVSLEGEISQKNDELNHLRIKVAESEAISNQLNDMRAQMMDWKNDCESKETKLKATEKEIAQLQVLDKEMKVRDAEIQTLRAKLTEAERMSRIVPEMQVQMDQFSETFIKLNRELEGAHQAVEKLSSVKSANDKLQQDLVELQEEISISEKARTAAECLEQKIQQKDSQITELQERLAILHVESQRREIYHEGDSETVLEHDFSQETWSLVDSLVQQDIISNGSEQSKLDDTAAERVYAETEPNKKQKCADRSASSYQGLTEPTNATFLNGNDAATPGSAVVRLDEKSIGEVDGSHAPTLQNAKEPDVIPESQPCSIDLSKSCLETKVRTTVAPTVISSSPLSDVGELFDSSPQDQLENPQHGAVRDAGHPDASTAKDSCSIEQPSLPEQSRPEDGLLGSECTQRTGRPGEPVLESGPPSSSYGEPLLLDDLEGLRLLPSSSAADPRKRSIYSSQDILTSPPDGVSRKLFQENRIGTLASKSLARSGTKTVGLIEYGQYMTKNPSPRRLRSREPSFQAITKQLPEEQHGNASGMRSTTPDVLVKEKHQPNSAIKRKYEAAGVVDDTRGGEKPRAKRKLSSTNLSSQPETVSKPTVFLSPGKGQQTLSRIRQSSVSGTASRSRVGGKVAPALGGVKQGLKRSRGGLKSEILPIALAS